MGRLEKIKSRVSGFLLGKFLEKMLILVASNKQSSQFKCV